MRTGRVIVGGSSRWDGRQPVRYEGTITPLGFVRFQAGRWFAEGADRLPLEGTFRRRRDAVDAVLESLNIS